MPMNKVKKTDLVTIVFVIKDVVNKKERLDQCEHLVK